MRLLRSMDSMLKWSNREGNQICKIPDIWWCGHLVMKQTAYQDHIEIKLLISRKSVTREKAKETNNEITNCLETTVFTWESFSAVSLMILRKCRVRTNHSCKLLCFLSYLPGQLSCQQYSSSLLIATKSLCLG